MSRDEALQTRNLDPLMGDFTLAATPGLLNPPPELKYHELGMLAQMDEAARSFLTSNNLSPLRVLLWGPPLSGKTALAQVIAKQYSLRRIHAQYLVDEVLAEQVRSCSHTCIARAASHPLLVQIRPLWTGGNVGRAAVSAQLIPLLLAPQPHLPNELPRLLERQELVALRLPFAVAQPVRPRHPPLVNRVCQSPVTSCVRMLMWDACGGLSL